jgi:hypothetical protein
MQALRNGDKSMRNDVSIPYTAETSEVGRIGAAEGICGRVIFAALSSRTPVKFYRKNSDSPLRLAALHGHMAYTLIFRLSVNVALKYPVRFETNHTPSGHICGFLKVFNTLFCKGFMCFSFPSVTARSIDRHRTVKIRYWPKSVLKEWKKSG